MTDVRISLSADPSGLQNALKRAQDELRRLTEQMRAAGRAGQDFGKIDFGGLPDEMARHMERVQKQYRDILSLNSDLRRRLEMSGQQGASPFDIDWDRMGYLNRRTQEEARRRVIEQSARGTPWQPPAGGGGQGGGAAAGAEDGEGGGRRGGVGGIASTVWGGLKLGAGLLGVQTGIGLISQAFQGARNTAQATDQFVRRTRETGETFTSIRDRLKALGDGLQLTNEESAQLGLAFQKAANEADPQTAIAGARGAAGFGRSYGIAPEITAQSMGALQFLGATGKGGLSQRQMLLLIGKTISDGMLGGKAEQVIEGLGRHVEAFVGKTMQAPGDIAEYMGLIAAMGQLRDKYPGLAGPGGARLIEQAGQAIQSPGGGLGGEFLVTRALQGAGLGGGDPFKLLYERQGMSALTRLPNGKTAIEQIMDEANRHLGGGNPYQASVMTGEVLGMTGKQVTALRDALTRARGTSGGVDAWESRLKAAGVDLSQVNESGIKDIGDIMAANPETLKEIGARRGAPPELQGEALRDALLKIAAEQGRQQNEATKAQDAMVTALNGLQNAIGQPLLDALGELGQAVKELTPPVKGIAEWLGIKTGTQVGATETQATGANASIFSARRWGYELDPRNWFKRSDTPGLIERLDNWMNRNNPNRAGGYQDPREAMLGQSTQSAATPAGGPANIGPSTTIPNVGPSTTIPNVGPSTNRSVWDAVRDWWSGGYQDPHDAMMNRSTGTTSAPTTGAAAMMAAAIATPETGRVGALTDPARFIRTRVTPAQNAGRSSSAYGPLQMTKTYLESFKRRQYNNLPAHEQEYLDGLIKQGSDFLAADRAGAYRDPIHGYGGTGTMGDTQQERETYMSIAQKSLADLAQQSPNYDSFIRQFRGENDPRYFDAVRRQTGKTPEELFHELRKTDIRAMGDQKPLGFDANLLRPKPRDDDAPQPNPSRAVQLPAPAPGFDATPQPKPLDFTPIPEGTTPPATAPATDPGRVDIYLHQRDSKGTAVGAPAQHRLDLTQRSPHGSIDVENLFGATA